MRAYAQELAGLSLDVILVVSNPVLAAMRQAAPATGQSCSSRSATRLEAGLSRALRHPGGNHHRIYAL